MENMHQPHATYANMIQLFNGNTNSNQTRVQHANQQINENYHQYQQSMIQGPQCLHCGKIYSNASNLRQHVRNVHVSIDKSLWHSCTLCGKKLKTKHYLINHQLQAHGIHQRGVLENSET